MKFTLRKSDIVPHDGVAIYRNVWKNFISPNTLIDLDFRIVDYIPSRLIGIELFAPGVGFNFPHDTSCISDIQDSSNVPLAVKDCRHKWRKFARDLILNGVIMTP